MTLLEIASNFPLRYINAVSMALGENDEQMLDFVIMGYTLQEYKNASAGLLQMASDKLALGL